MAHYIHTNKQKHIKPVSEITLKDAFEHLLYEVKPIFYTMFSALILRSAYSNDLLVKILAICVFLFGAFVIYARLHNRGFIK